MINSKLTIGLDKLGLQTELYLLGLSDTVFILLGIKDNERGEALFEHYLELRQKVEEIDLIKSYYSLDGLALEIYNELVERKRVFELSVSDCSVNPFSKGLAR